MKIKNASVVILASLFAFYGFSQGTNMWKQVSPNSKVWSVQDPVGLGLGLYIDGVFTPYTNQPHIVTGGTSFNGYATDTVARATAAYAYSPTNPPPASTDILARAAAAYAYSPTNQPFALTNVLISADRDTNGWWTLYIITNEVRSVMQ